MLDRKTHNLIVQMPMASGVFSKERVETAEHFLRYCRILQAAREEKWKEKAGVEAPAQEIEKKTNMKK